MLQQYRVREVNMKGKVTKDIFLRVGQGVMRIPRDKADSDLRSQESFTTTSSRKSEEKKNHPANKLDRS